MTVKNEGIVESVGTATRSGLNKIGSIIEKAMADAVLAIQKESEEIWAGIGTIEEKTKKIAAINEPEAVKARMMAARQAVKDANKPKADDAAQ